MAGCFWLAFFSVQLEYNRLSSLKSPQMNSIYTYSVLGIFRFDRFPFDRKIYVVFFHFLCSPFYDREFIPKTIEKIPFFQVEYKIHQNQMKIRGGTNSRFCDLRRRRFQRSFLINKNFIAKHKPLSCFPWEKRDFTFARLSHDKTSTKTS